MVSINRISLGAYPILCVRSMRAVRNPCLRNTHTIQEFLPGHSSPCPQAKCLVHQLHSGRFLRHQVGLRTGRACNRSKKKQEKSGAPRNINQSNLSSRPQKPPHNLCAVVWQGWHRKQTQYEPEQPKPNESELEPLRAPKQLAKRVP